MINTRPAQIYCANYNVGKCLGCMIKCTKDGTIYQLIDSKMKGKDCNPDDCIYFETSVLPVIE
jgi:hypothetical protein